MKGFKATHFFCPYNNQLNSIPVVLTGRKFAIGEEPFRFHEVFEAWDKFGVIHLIIKEELKSI